MERCERFRDVAEIDHPPQVRGDFTSDVYFYLERMPMKTTAFVPLWGVGQEVCRLDREVFEYLHLHRIARSQPILEPAEASGPVEEPAGVAPSVVPVPDKSERSRTLRNLLLRRKPPNYSGCCHCCVHERRLTLCVR
jgi:hypothetical protein